MSLEKAITISCVEGHIYQLSFSKFTGTLPITINKPVVDVVIAIDGTNDHNNAKVLFAFSKHTKEYLIEHDVILYCFCSDEDIHRVEKHQIHTPQKYRSLLFQKLFERILDNTFINKLIVLVDAENKTYYIHLFARASSIDTIEALSTELEEIGNK